MPLAFESLFAAIDQAWQQPTRRGGRKARHTSPPNLGKQFQTVTIGQVRVSPMPCASLLSAFAKKHNKQLKEQLQFSVKVNPCYSNNFTRGYFECYSQLTLQNSYLNRKKWVGSADFSTLEKIRLPLCEVLVYSGVRNNVFSFESCTVKDAFCTL